MIKIDGSMMEGGGSIIRNAVSLAAVLGKPIEIINIRAKRSKPGLRNQHTFVVKTIAEMCQAEVEGAFVGSNAIRFIPGEIIGGEFEIDVKTAGSLTLLLQALLPVAAKAPEQVRFLMKGGTDVPFAPPFEYLKHVYLPMLAKIGLDTTICLGRRGHYPKGGGRLICDVSPLIRAKPIDFHFPGQKLEVKCICGKAHAVKLPSHIPERMISSALSVLSQYNYPLGAIEPDCPEEKYDVHLGPGTGITLWTCTNFGTILAGDCLGKRGVTSETVGTTAAKNLVEQLVSGRPIDYHLADQLIAWMALSDFPSVIDTGKLTLHTLTNVELAQMLTNARFTVEGELDKPAVISCEPNAK